ncbi:MAG: hypothetical protein D9V47_08905 [Clostridia bacterium]|nr:MAG: hypothetical protein D9V47_08905 [Clostridia bacterium]
MAHVQDLEITCETVAKESSLECGLAGAVAAVSGLKGSTIILHSPPGCGWTARWARSDFAINNYVPLVPDNLLQHNLIFGASQKLYDSARWAMERWKPKQLFLMAGCAGSLIADPMNEIATEMEKKYGSPVIVLDRAGFRGMVATGMDETFAEILGRLTADGGGEKDPDSVNIVAPYLMGSSNWVYDLEEIRGLLEAIGLKVNCILTFNTTLEQLREFPRASADIYLTWEDFPQMREYEKRHDIVRLGQDLPLPIGAANTDQWYMSLARHFGKEAEAQRVMREQVASLRYLKFHYNATWVSTWIANKYAAVIGPAIWAASYARFLYYDMAAYPSVIALYGETQESIETAKEVLKDLTGYYDSLILENPLYIQVVKALNERNPEFVVGQTQDKSLVEGNGFPHITMSGLQTILGGYNFMPYPSVGIKGILRQFEALGHVVEKTFHEPRKWAALAHHGREPRPEKGPLF